MKNARPKSAATKPRARNPVAKTLYAVGMRSPGPGSILRLVAASGGSTHDIDKAKLLDKATASMVAGLASRTPELAGMEIRLIPVKNGKIVRNPSSGSKQAARGVRKWSAQDHVGDTWAKGRIHARGTKAAEAIRKDAATYGPNEPKGKAKAKARHFDTVMGLHAWRPPLPNPADDPHVHGRSIVVHWADGSTMPTRINGTRAEIEKYYVGRTFNVGSGEHDRMLKAVRVDFLAANPGSGTTNGSINQEFLAKIDAGSKSKILANIANHYGITVGHALSEVTDADAEHLLDYMTGPERTAASVLMKRHGTRNPSSGAKQTARGTRKWSQHHAYDYPVTWAGHTTYPSPPGDDYERLISHLPTQREARMVGAHAALLAGAKRRRLAIPKITNPASDPHVLKRPIVIHWEDGDTTHTWINGTRKDIRAYYVGKTFNVGFGPRDNMLKALSVEFLDADPARNPSSGAKQRARGTRKFTSGRMSDGEIHAAGTRHMEGARADAAWLRTAGPAEREEAMRAYNVFGYPHELHWQGKGMAEAHRPRLPNPSSGTRQQALAFDAKPLAAKVPPAYLTVCIQDSERFQEDPPTKNAIMVRAKSLREASDLCRAYIGMHGHGYSTWYGGEVFLAGKLVARISYNGRAWAPGRYPTPEIPLDAVLLPTRNPGGAKQRARGTRAFSMRYAVDQANKPGAMHAYAMEMAEVARKAGDKAEHGHYLAQARGVRSEHPGMDDAITTLGLRLLSFRAKLVFEAQRDTARRGSGDTHFVATKLTDPKASAFTHYFEAPAGASADVAAMVEDYNAHSYGEETRTLAEQREIVATRFGKVANPSSGAKQRARNTRGIRGQIDPSMTGWPSDGSHHGWTMTEAAELRAEGRKYPAWDYSGQRVDRGIVKQHAEYMDYARSKRPALPNPSALTLLYFPANAAWAFVYGTDHKSMRPIAMGSYDHFFADRKQAIHAARVQGLSVSRTGEVSIAGKR